MKTTLINLTSRRKQSLQLLVNQSIRKGLDQKATFELFLQDLEKKGNIEYVGTHNVALAMFLYYWSTEQAKVNHTPAIMILCEYAHYKYLGHTNQLGGVAADKGAFGDLIEVLVRVASKPEALITLNDLHVADVSKADIVLRGVKTEIGTNGKTFGQSSYDIPLGNFERFIYGTFTENDKIKIFNLCMNEQYKKAIEYVLKHMYIIPLDQIDTFFNSAFSTNQYIYQSHTGHFVIRATAKGFIQVFKEVAPTQFTSLSDFLNK